MKIAEKGELTVLSQEILERLESYVSGGEKIFSTSSFQTQSLPLLHIISESGLDIPVYFTNTGFLHAETISFAEYVSELLDLQLIQLYPDIPKVNQLNHEGRFLYTSDPDFCCHLNKIAPLERILYENDIWINGVRADQSPARANLSEEQQGKHNCKRYHPMLYWNSKLIYNYRKLHSLPEHPLEKQGYFSVGCEPCTSKITPGDNERNSRWFGMSKTECGLNTILASDRED